MCRPTVQDHTDAQVLERLQQRLQQQLNLNCGPLDHLAHVASRGSGPRLFCGHVPPECSEELVKAHFSQWGHVLDVYFPKRKDTFRRRPFCFVTFNRLEDAQRALAESPMNICGIPIKQLNLVEDRSDYYKHRHQAAQSALVQALQTLALLGDGAPAGPAAPASMAAHTPPVDLNNLAALLSLENAAGAGPAQLQARPQPYPMHQTVTANGYDSAARYAPGPGPAPLPFANLPGFSQAGLVAGASTTGLAMPSAAPAYVPQPAFPPASTAVLAAALAGRPCTDWPLPAGASSPFSTLDAAQHASADSSPPKSDELAQLAAAMHQRTSGGSSSSGSASPDLDGAAANRLAMWQLQNELLGGEGPAAPPRCDWNAPASLAAQTTVN
ncbi:expressed protein [Chlorella variabilis]|uniref:Expressed protein n=1 Tax=Chlorella variabilis TaxID=554065 RepID=E1ZTM5_CHLVA|nr:expressed protein [Chlorella variabilis]EFN50834.1 expressed protein [Chlorella variabilis]|eukprot:XP_005842936.1 expressed protein [Chlorella variabilis]